MTLKYFIYFQDSFIIFRITINGYCNICSSIPVMLIVLIVYYNLQKCNLFTLKKSIHTVLIHFNWLSFLYVWIQYV